MQYCTRLERYSDIACGEASDEARAKALREFGNVGLVKEATRAMWGFRAARKLAANLQYRHPH